jgi:hypothetical protein
MTLIEFKKTLNNPAPPAVSALLQALWYDAKGDWEKAHAVAQDVNTKDGSWIHAYLHRKEGDQFNAQYWYDRVNRSMPTASLEEEWNAIAEDLLNS